MKPIFKTKGDLRSTLLTRLGYGGLGASAGNYVSMANDLLDEAQEEIFDVLPNRYRVQDFDFNIGVDQKWADIPSKCEPDRIKQVRVFYAGYWFPLNEGIDYAHDSVSDTTSYPQRYSISFNPDTDKAQIEFWPDTDAIYPIRVVSELLLDPFVSDGDFCSIDYRLLLMHAEAWGKSHLNKPDKNDAMRKWNLRLRKLKAAQHKDKKYVRGDNKHHEVLAKPILV